MIMRREEAKDFVIAVQTLKSFMAQQRICSFIMFNYIALAVNKTNRFRYIEVFRRLRTSKNERCLKCLQHFVCFVLSSFAYQKVFFFSC